MRKGRVYLSCLCLLWLVATASPTRAANYVVAWGLDFEDRISVPSGLTNAAAVAATDISLALAQDGSVLGWGSHVPVQTTVPPGTTGVVAIAAGDAHAVALKSNGRVLAWGYNTLGQTNVPSGLTNVMAVSAGWAHSLALSGNGTLTAWGYADSGRTAIPPGLSNIVAISAGGAHNLALKSDGTVVAWGANYAGQTNVPPGLSNVLSIAAGASHSVAIKGDRTIIAWGDSAWGKTNVPAGLSNVVAVAAGEYFNLAIKNDGTFAAWGWGDNLRRTAEVPPGLTNVIAVAAGRLHSLAVAIVNDGAPIVTRHPSYRDAYSGMPVSFQLTAEGSPPPACQWQFNESNISGATNFSLQLSNVQPADAGSYQAVLTNPHGAALSLAADLTVSDSRPYVSIQPSDQIIYQGTDCTLMVGAVGSWPLRYQWLLNGTNIAGATGTSMLLGLAQKTNTGAYSVVITNSFGSVTSAVAVVTVYDLADALNSNLLWVTSGDSSWFGENQYPGYFTPAGRSGSLTNNQSSTLQTTVAGPGTLTFQWKVSSEPAADFLIFSINGAEQKRVSGTVDWQEQTFYLGAGTQNLQWTYAKDASGSAGQDAAWLDGVSFTNVPTLPTITLQPVHQPLIQGSNITLNVSAYGTPPLSYQWQFNGADIIGANGNSLALLNVQLANEGRYRAVITNPYGSTTSAEVALFTYVGPAQPQDALDRWYLRSPVQLAKVRFVGGLFIGLGNNGTIMTSPDGEVWTVRNSGTAAALAGATCGTLLSPSPHKLFIVVGAQGTILTSGDAVTWAPVSATSLDLNDVAWNGTRFVASTTITSTGQPNVLYSADGTNWMGAVFYGNLDSGLPCYTSSIGTAGKYFITAGGSDFAYDIWVSNDGEWWDKMGFSDQVVEGIASGNSRTVMVGWEGWPRVSTNSGASWFVSAFGVMPSGYLPMVGSDIAFGNGTFLVTRSFLRNGFLTTMDGVVWSSRPVFSGASVDSAAYGAGSFVVTCSGGTYPAGIYQSENVARPTISLMPQNPGTILLSISGEIGRPYRLQSSSDLQGWSDTQIWTNTAPTTQFFEAIPPGSSRLFFRARTP